jgi:hypothetical protein
MVSEGPTRVERIIKGAIKGSETEERIVDEIMGKRHGGRAVASTISARVVI